MVPSAQGDLAPSARSHVRGPRGATGPVGPAGPTGTQGPTGPTETIQVKRTAGVNFALAAGAGLTHASAAIPPGSWLLDAQVKIFYPGGSAYFDCDLKTGAGDGLIRSTLRVGEGSGATTAGTIPLHVAATFATTTQVVLTCVHPEGPLVGGPPSANEVVLTATRIGQLDER